MVVLGVQLAGIQRPFSGHFASYQLVMASMARNMLHENFKEILLPKTDLIVGGKKSLHLNQYPFPSLAVALSIRFFGGTMEFWGRFQAIVCNALTALLVGLIAARLFTSLTGWIAATIYALSPFTLVYGQGFFSESMALFFLALSLYLILRVAESRFAWLEILLSALSFSIAVAGRVHFVFFYPVWLFHLFFSSGKEKIIRSLIFTVFALALPVAWFAHTYFASVGADNVLSNVFLQMGMRKVGDQNYLTRLDYYGRIFDHVSQFMLTPLVFPFFILGFSFLKEKKTALWVTAGGLIFGCLVGLVSPQKVMAHDFYLYGIFPFLCMVAARGVEALLDAFPFFRKTRTVMVLLLLYFLISARYFMHPIFKYPDSKQQIQMITQAIEKNTQPNDLLVVAANEPAIMHYYADRAGWTMELNHIGRELMPYLKNPRFSKIDPAEIERYEKAMKDPVSWLEYLREKGASYFLAPRKEELTRVPNLLNYLLTHYSKLSPDTDDFFLFNLTPAA